MPDPDSNNQQQTPCEPIKQPPPKPDILKAKILKENFSWKPKEDKGNNE